jgi:hypothetical protein
VITGNDGREIAAPPRIRITMNDVVAVHDQSFAAVCSERA